MKIYVLLRIAWPFALGLIIYLKSYVVSALDWFAANPTMYTESFGFTPLVIILTLALLSRKIINRLHGN